MSLLKKSTVAKTLSMMDVRSAILTIPEKVLSSAISSPLAATPLSKSVTVDLLGRSAYTLLKRPFTGLFS